MEPGWEPKSSCTGGDWVGHYLWGTCRIRIETKHLWQALPGILPNFCGKGNATGKEMGTRKRSEGMGPAAQMIFISKIHPHAVMETSVTIKHVTVNLIYAACFLEGQPKMVQLYTIMKYIKNLKPLAIKYHQWINRCKLCWIFQC